MSIIPDDEDLPLDALREAVLQCFPDLSNASFRKLSPGWHSSALEANESLIFKFPRSAAAVAALQREASLLQVVAPSIGTPVPRLTLHRSCRLFSRHLKLPGEQLLSDNYRQLAEAARERLAEDLARFYAELHRLDHATLRAAGAMAIEAWQPPDRIRERALPLLPAALRARAEQAVWRWEELAPDPHGLTFGYFDGHGWNFAFDHERQQLNGIYDFGDSGFGALHQEFIYSNLISPDLTVRLIRRYEELSGRYLDHERITLLTDIHRLSELAELADEGPAAEAMLQQLLKWWRVSSP